MASKPILELNEVSAGYGKNRVLHGVSMSVAQSEIVSVIGHNGAGKTTILRVIMGLLPPSRGTIGFDGQDITNMKGNLILRKGLSYVPEGHINFTQMSVMENLEMGAYIEKDSSNVKEAVRNIFDLFPILHARRNVRAGALSGGEQQMLSIGRSLMIRPKLLLLDEPSLGLAPKLVAAIYEKINELRDQGMTIVIVEQNAVRGLETADRGYVVEFGCVKFQGAASELINNSEVKRLYMGA